MRLIHAPPTLRHPDESQDPEPGTAAPVTLDPDFRQDDERGGAGVPLTPFAIMTDGGVPASPHTLRHPDESQDPEPGTAAPVTLDPDFRQDDERGGAGVPLTPFAIMTDGGVPASPHTLRHPDESQDPEPETAPPVTLGPDVRQDVEWGEAAAPASSVPSITSLSAASNAAAFAVPAKLCESVASRTIRAAPR